MKRWTGRRLVKPAVFCISLAMISAAACGGSGSGTGSLPPNLVEDAGTQITAFDSPRVWSVSGGRMTPFQSERREGAGSLGLQTTPGGKAVAEKTISQDLSGPGLLRFWVFFHPDWNGTVNSVKVSFSPAADFGSSLTYYLTNLTGMHDGWNLMSVPKRDFQSGGGASWSKPMIRLRIELVADEGKVAEASVDDLRCGVVAKPAIVISFDDGDASVYSTAYPIMSAHGLHGTVYVVSSAIDTPGKMSLAQLRKLYADGWDIGDHTSTHADLATVDLVSAERELGECASYLRAHGMPRGARDVAYPDGSYNQTVLDAMAASGMLTGRTVSYRPEALPLDERFQIPASGANATQMTVAQIEANIDRAVADGATIHLFFHALAPTATGYAQSIANFTAICDYINKVHLRALTISEFSALSHS